MTNRTPLRLWAVSDGRAGMENQALGLAEAIGRQWPCQIERKRIAISAPFDRLPRWMWGDALRRISPEGDPLDAPLPDIWIGCGRRTVPVAMAMFAKGVFVVQTQDPRAPADRFDLVVPPTHDELVGPNVLPTIGSPNRLTAAQIEADAAALAQHLPPLPRPLAAVLLGGPSKDFRLDPAAQSALIDRLTKVAKTGYGLLVTPSRRTPDSLVAALREAVGERQMWVWDGRPVGPLENPYFGMLGLAERVLVTEESTNMITDAAFTGKPLERLPLAGGAPKWARFAADLERHGISSETTYSPLRETDRVASEILERLKTAGVISPPTEAGPVFQPAP